MRTILRLISSLSMGVALAIFALGTLIPQKAEAAPVVAKPTCSGSCVCSWNPTNGYFCGGIGGVTGCSRACGCNLYYGLCFAF